jgi:hypothetical protein
VSRRARATDVSLEERDALYEQVLDHLSGIGDLWAAIQREDFATADRLGREFGDDLRLVEDLGWGDGPAAKTIELTMPAEQLHRIFTRLRADAEGLRHSAEREEAEAEAETQEYRQRAARVTEACERVLSAVSRRPPPELLGDGR